MIISTYHEYVLEGSFSLRIGLTNITKSYNISDEIEKETLVNIANLNCRYSFLMFANALEAAANALLMHSTQDKSLYFDLEKQKTLLKFRIFCKLHGKELNISDQRYNNIKELIQVRNEFVHPKPKDVEFVDEKDLLNLELNTKKTKSKTYPLYFGEINEQHAIEALKDILDFIAWVCFDICELPIGDGALILGLGTVCGNNDIEHISRMVNTEFDYRTFSYQGKHSC